MDDHMGMMDRLKGKSGADMLENLSLLLIGLSTAMILTGVVVGSFVSGLPVLVGILGSVLLIVSIVFLIVTEFYKIFNE